jgi:Protein of unknown function (Hypoth_ymh).
MLLLTLLDDLCLIEKNKAFLDNLFWDYIHPDIRKISESRFKSGHFADSVEAALKEINSLVKVIVKKLTGEELDGSKLMFKAFSGDDPIIKSLMKGNRSIIILVQRLKI